MARCLFAAAATVCGAVNDESYSPSDQQATAETKALMTLLGRVSASPSFLFGHHNTNYQGQNWTDASCSQKTSDVELGVGQFPGLFEYNFAWVTEKNDDLLPHVRHATSVGAIVELHWEPSNPVTGGDVQDISGDAVRQILPGGSAHATWTGWLDTLADFAGQVGHPIVFRLFHENTGGWFWWGSSSTQPTDFRKAFQFTIDYLRTVKGVHNLLVAYSPSKPSDYSNAFSSDSDSLYPGDDYVDIACFDRYAEDDFHEALLKDCDEVVAFAEEHKKIPAICESGAKSGTQTLSPGVAPTWWNASFLEPIKSSASSSKVAWALTWANAADSYWVPVPGEPALAGFQSFHADAATLFAGDFSLPWSAESSVLV